jgi:hypothetical protein
MICDVVPVVLSVAVELPTGTPLKVFGGKVLNERESAEQAETSSSTNADASRRFFIVSNFIYKRETTLRFVVY